MSQLGSTAFERVNFEAYPAVRPAMSTAALQASMLRGEILDAMSLTQVPRNDLLIKGIFETQGESIPLVDVRTQLRGPGGDSGDMAVGVIIRFGKQKLGLILDAGADD